MLDSVVFRVNNIHRYPLLLNYLINNSKAKIHEAFARIETNPDAMWFKLRTQQFEIEGEKHLSVRGEKVTSSHYNLGWSIPLGTRASYVEFNFSIPKLLYGTNIFQFVQHNTEVVKTLWDAEQGKSYEWNVKNTHKRFVKFMSLFFDKIFDFTGERVAMEDMEIRRMDLTWNQLFHNKKDALEYLGYQKEIHKKHSRTKMAKRNFDTSVFFSTRDYGAKIYHKGSEYKSSKGEKNKHKQINVNEGKMVFDTNELQIFADRILRYEITFRAAYLSKIYRTKVFRKDSRIWQIKMKRWRRLRRVYTYANTNAPDSFAKGSERWKTLTETRKKYQRLWSGELVPGHIQISKDDREFYDWWARLKERRVCFQMSVNPVINAFNTGFSDLRALNTKYDGRFSENYNCKTVPSHAFLSADLFEECFKIFTQFKRDFKIGEVAYLSDSAKKIHLHNENVKRFNLSKLPSEKLKSEVSFSKIKQLLFLLQSHSADYLKRNELIPATTLWRYQKLFKSLDINFGGGSKLKIPNCPRFEWYHEALVFDNFAKYLRNDIFF